MAALTVWLEVDAVTVAHLLQVAEQFTAGVLCLQALLQFRRVAWPTRVVFQQAVAAALQLGIQLLVQLAGAVDQRGMAGG